MSDAKRYRVLDPVGLDYPTAETRGLPRDQWKIKRARPGSIVDDLAEESIAWLKKQGYVEVVKDEPAVVSAPKPEPAKDNAP